ncbi:ABC transporter substrate-binding protein [Naasia aerilata]|uniref:ABC transporter substrate-binding protein n=1 Tax=Naasia aerilata TaxID=1162966 RepID=UPI002572572F|nr:sugar ABC transporter substrate-binding protein [Naasia aerilata]
MAFGLTGCSAGPAKDSGPITLEYWTWAPNVPDAVATWNKAHPDVQVKVTEAAGADDILAKVLAAQRAGNGPDMFAAEYQKLPNFVVSGAALDITDMIGKGKDDFAEGTWSQTTVGGKIYAVPQDVGPMVFMYRADLFEQYGLEVPKTWDEYAALAAKVKQVAPNAYLGGYPDDGSTFIAYAQPLKADWWSTDGDSWSVGIDGAASKRVADFWQPLVEQGLIDTTHFFTPEWGQKMNDGTLLSWTAGAWAPGAALSVAPDTAGKWKIAHMPSWDGETTSGVMGGSSAAITPTSKHPKESMEFLEWLNGSEEGSNLLASGGCSPHPCTGRRISGSSRFRIWFPVSPTSGRSPPTSQAAPRQ